MQCANPQLRRRYFFVNQKRILKVPILLMPAPVFRFRIVSDSGEESSNWRIWTQRENVYVGVRLMTDTYKASFHETGECHVGITTEVRKTLVGNPSWTGKTRHFSGWTLDPLDADTGLQNLVDILFPDSYLGPPGPAEKSKATILRSQPSTITAVSVIRARLPENAYLHCTDTSVSELFGAPLPSGRMLLVVRSNLLETPEYRTEIRSQMLSRWSASSTPSGRTYGTKPAGSPDENVRALLWNGTNQRKRWSEVSAQKLLLSVPL